MRSVIEYNIPPVKCFLHHAFPLGTFWNDKDAEIMKWFCANYNYVFASPDPETYFYSYLIDYNNIPFLQKRCIFGDELYKILETKSFYEVIIEFIKNQNAVEIMADEFYLSCSKAYNKNHFMHELMVIGYDDLKETFIIRGYYNSTFQELEVAFDEVIPFENCPYYGDDVVIKLYRKKNAYFVLTPDMFWHQISDYCFNVNPYNKIGNFYGIFFEIWDKEFGINSIGIMNKKIESQEKLDLIFLRLVYEHYSCMLMKIEFLQKLDGFNITSELINNYKTMARKALVNLRVGLKHNLLNEKSKRIILRQKIVEDIQNMLYGEKQILIQSLKNNGYLCHL